MEFIIVIYLGIIAFWYLSSIKHTLKRIEDLLEKRGGR